MSKRKAVAIVSGGLDSTVLAYLMRASRDADELHLLSFNYGQRHKRELEYAAATSTRLKCEWTKIDLEKAGLTTLLKGSALTDAAVEVPEGHYAADSMRATIVPNRNSIMLAIAYAAAVADGAEEVGIAVHSGDHAVYPDCRPEFISAFQQAERQANLWSTPITLVAPFLFWSKARIVRAGADLNVPFRETWSCYKGGEVHCGACGTCVERREAFKLAGVQDPTAYMATPEFEAPRGRA